MPIEIFNLAVGTGIVLLQITTGILLLTLAVSALRKLPLAKKACDRIAPYAHRIMQVSFIGSAIGSFIYEYGYGYAPCLLCWYQRLAIFGIAIIVSAVDIRADRTAQKLVMVFSAIGLTVASFHNYIDIFPSSGTDVCGVNGVSCLIRYVYEFGYITIPMMSLTVLLFGLCITVIARKKNA